MYRLLGAVTVLAFGSLLLTPHSSLFGQDGGGIANAWQSKILNLPPEPTDPALRQELAARGAIFDSYQSAKATFIDDAGRIHAGFGSRGARGELPVVGSDAIAVATFYKHIAHLTSSGKGVYTEIIFSPQEVLLRGPGDMRLGYPFSVLENGGAVRLPNSVVVSTPVTPEELGLQPDHKYLLFLTYKPAGAFYELIKSWDITTGIATPNSPEDFMLAKAHGSSYAGQTEETLLAAVRAAIHGK